MSAPITTCSKLATLQRMSQNVSANRYQNLMKSSVKKRLIYNNKKTRFQFVPLLSVIRKITNGKYVKKHDDYNVSRTMSLERIQKTKRYKICKLVLFLNSLKTLIYILYIYIFVYLHICIFS